MAGLGKTNSRYHNRPWRGAGLSFCGLPNVLILRQYLDGFDEHWKRTLRYMLNESCTIIRREEGGGERSDIVFHGV